jgi:hypothetical protein
MLRYSLINDPTQTMIVQRTNGVLYTTGPQQTFSGMPGFNTQVMNESQHQPLLSSTLEPIHQLSKHKSINSAMPAVSDQDP